MIYSLRDFIGAYQEIVDMGWIQTHRANSTGVGKTLEDLLGIPENNRDEPDFADYELKATRINSSAMLTMFTKTMQPSGANEALRVKYGYSSDAYDNNRKVLHTTLTADRLVPIYNTGKSLTLHCTEDRIFVASKNEIENAYWDISTIERAFNKKYSNKFVYAKADSRGRGAAEEFRYLEAYVVSGFDFDALIELLRTGDLCVDIRIGQYPDGRTHDHGTAFRIKDSKQYLLFKSIERIV